MLKIILKKNTTIRIFFKPRKNKIETLLRPPYRHKISRHQLTISRYSISVFFHTLLKNKITSVSVQNCLSILKEIGKSFKYFETNICYVHSIRIRILFTNNSFFKLMNYKF